MERTLVLEHKKFFAKVPQPRRVFKRDWDLSVVENERDFDFRRERFEEYKTLGFPVWKRTPMEGIDLPGYSRNVTVRTRGFTSGECDTELLKNLDFEGSDRKYVLLVDVFNNAFVCARISKDVELEIEFPDLSIDQNLIVFEGNSKFVRRVKGKGLRVSNDRFLFKKGSKVVVVDIVEVDGVNVSNSFFHLEEGSKVEYHQLVIGSERSVVYLHSKLFEGSSLNVLHRSVQDGGITDALFSGRFEGESASMNVDAKGAVRSGKVVFRGVLDLKRGVKGVEARENFKAFLLSEDARFESIPSIFASENELSASHGASATPLSDEEIFYMESRGLSREELIELIVNDMIEEVKELAHPRNL